MQLLWKKRKKGSIEYGIIFGAVALFLLAAARFFPVLSLAPVCFLQTVVGIPCPTCGGSHAVVSLAYGNIFESFRANPLVCLTLLFSLPFFFYNIITLLFDFPTITVELTEKEKKLPIIFIVVLVVLNWLYLMVSTGHL